MKKILLVLAALTLTGCTGNYNIGNQTKTSPTMITKANQACEGLDGLKYMQAVRYASPTGSIKVQISATCNTNHTVHMKYEDERLN